MSGAIRKYTGDRAIQDMNASSVLILIISQIEMNQIYCATAKDVWDT